MTATTAAPSTDGLGGAPVPVAEAESVAARVRWAIADGWAIAKRDLTHIRYIPEKLLDVTVQPIIFVLLFVYVFGSAVSVPGQMSYKDFLMAGIFVQTLTFATASTAISVADDMAKGVIDRFRSLPMARSAVLVGQTTSDLCASVLCVVILAATGLAIGWRMHNGVASALAGFALLLFWSYSMSWLGTLIGLSVRAPEAAQTIVFLVAFPLTFVANTFVPTAGMPPWLRTIADWNPISAVVAAVRELFGNNPPIPPGTPWPLRHAIPAALFWCVGLLVVCLPLAVRRYRSTTAH